MPVDWQEWAATLQAANIEWELLNAQIVRVVLRLLAEAREEHQ